MLTSVKLSTGLRTLLLLAAITAIANSPAEAGAAKVSSSVTFQTAAQADAAATKAIALRVTASTRGLVGVSIRNSSGRLVAHSKGLTFATAGTKSLKLQLNSTGLTQVRGCAASGQIRWTVGTTSAGVKSIRTLTLAGDENNCLPKDSTATCRDGDPLDRFRCLLPFPNDLYTTPDQSTATGRRLNLPTALMPVSSRSIRINPAPYNLNDGFSGNSAIITRVPGLDSPAALTATGAATVRNIGRSMEADSPVVVIDATTGERWPVWSEIDASTEDEATRLFITRGAKVFAEGHRYVVAMRHLKRAGGSEIPAKEYFRWFRDKTIPSSAPASAKARVAHMESIFSTLQTAGIDRASLYQAWDFTVASSQNVTTPALTMRNKAFALLGDTNLADSTASGSAPQVTITKSQNYTLGESRYVLRRVDGTIHVPCFLGHTDYANQDVGNCGPGSRAITGSDGLPKQATDANGTPLFYDAKFTCIVPRSAQGSNQMGTNVRAVLFGHGLLGTGADVTAIKARAGLDRAVACGADWIGLSQGDISNAIGTLINLDRFPALADRSMQGLINFLYLGRWMISQAAGGMNATPEFQPSAGVLADPSQKLYFLGGSQGGIMGTALTALAPDFERAYLAVPAVGYSTLLNRSAAFEVFGPPVRIGYPDPATQQILLTLVQTLWDRGEGGGYVHHVTSDPLPGTPTHKVLMLEAFGDHLVTNIQTETEARTIGAVLRLPALDPGRSPDAVPFWGIEQGASSLFAGSGLDGDAGLVVVDIGPLRGSAPNFRGVTPEPALNVPPTPATSTAGNNGVDPHADAATSETSISLLFQFLRSDGAFATDEACGLAPCYAEGWTGPLQG